MFVRLSEFFLLKTKKMKKNFFFFENCENGQKLQIISKKSSVLAQKSDKNSLTYDKIKNMRGLLGHPF